MGLEEWEKAPAIGGEAATRAAGVGPMHWCWEIPAPLCTTCFLAFRDGKEAPWWARDRLQLVLPHVTPLPERCMRLITEFVRPGWVT